MEIPLILVIALLSIGFLACLFCIWVITFRFSVLLISTGYKFKYAGISCLSLLCGSGIVLSIWPISNKIGLAIMTFCWFSVLSLGCVFLAIGFYLYGSDFNEVMQSDAYQAELPAIPPSIEHKTDSTKIGV